MIYRQTSTQIIAEIIDESAKDDSTIITSSQSFSTYNRLKNDNVRTVDYLTNEFNYSILDETLNEIPVQNNFVYVSNYMSKNDRTFDSNPTIEIDFTKNHTSYGITLNFDGHYLPDEINVKYYKSNDTVIADDNFTVSSSDFFCDHTSLIKNYRKIIITFITTKYPYSFVKVNNIEYGVKFLWGSDDTESTSSLISAKIVEETDRLSNNLSMDTCEFTIFDELEDFNMLNTIGKYSIIRQYQKVKVYEIIETYDGSELINKESKFMGNFFIKEWTSNAQHEITFKCVDLIGVMEDVEFNLGAYYDPPVTAKSIIDKIMSCAGIGETEYSIANNIQNLKIEGFLPLMSCRQALQQVIFCVGAVADCARSETINIYIPSNNIVSIISDDHNLEYEQIQKNDVISDVFIYQSFLGAGSNNVKIFEGNLSVGTHTISSSSLIYAQLNVSPTITVGSQSGSITEVGLSHFKINVTSTDYFEVTATTWGIQKFKSVSVHNNDSKLKKEVKCENNYLLNDDNNTSPKLTYATDTAKRLLNYYSKPNTMETEFIVTNERTGTWCVFKNKYGNQTKGYIHRMDIDLTGGFLTKAKIVFVEDIGNLEYSYVCGNELYAGETNNDNIGLI